MFVRKTFCCLGVLVIVLLVAAVTEACPTCKEALGANNAGLVRGFGWSIVFMMSAPFLVLAGVGGYFYYEIRKARGRSNQQLPA